MCTAMSFRQLQKTWQKFGEEDPLWAILAHGDKKGNRWDLAEFLQTGIEEVGEVVEYARAKVPELRAGRALDFGCGVGRLSQALGDHFAEVDGVDIAASMVDRARSINRHGERVRYHLNGSDDLGLFGDQTFDFVYSNITLQHMQQEIARSYLREFARVLAPGGVAVVQMPSARKDPEPSGRLHRAVRYVRYIALRRPYLWWHRTLRGRPIMDMFAIARADMEGLLSELGLEVVDVVEDDRAGPHWTSFRYCVRKPGAKP